MLNYLSTRLGSTLPGWEAQQTMSPYTEKGQIEPRVLPVVPKKSAVLILFFPDKNNETQVLYTLRTKHMKKHSGQISFPGGRAEKGETAVETALRETWEEVGLHQSKVKVVGNLSKLDVYHSNSRVQPVVGFTDSEIEWKLSPIEVAEIITIPLKELMSESIQKTTTMKLGTQRFTVPYYDIHSIPLWGATAMITAELLAILRETNV